jgi:hypothetical protein
MLPLAPTKSPNTTVGPTGSPYLVRPLSRTMMRTLSLVCASVFLAAPVASASLLIDPTGGTVLQAGPNNDDISAGRSLGFSGTFFGVTHTTVDVSTNGNLNFSSSTLATNAAMPASIARISPLWDDFVVSGGASGESVSEKLDPGTSYSITWRTHHSTGSDARFQITWFGAATNVGGFDFLSGDIAFSYAAVFSNFASGNATVGLDAGNSSKFTPVPGDADGLITNGQSTLLPTGTGQFILFRPASSSSYSASVQSVPEPSSILLSASGIFYILLMRRTRPSSVQDHQA